jgi:hypothetical protein
MISFSFSFVLGQEGLELTGFVEQLREFSISVLKTQPYFEKPFKTVSNVLN